MFRLNIYMQATLRAQDQSPKIVIACQNIYIYAFVYLRKCFIFDVVSPFWFTNFILETSSTKVVDNLGL